jgi:hypothetical protein
MFYEVDSWDSTPGRSKNFLFSTSSRPALGPTQTPIQWIHGEFPRGIKWLVLEANFISIKCQSQEYVFIAWRLINEEEGNFIFLSKY